MNPIKIENDDNLDHDFYEFETVTRTRSNTWPSIQPDVPVNDPLATDNKELIDKVNPLVQQDVSMGTAKSAVAPISNKRLSKPRKPRKHAWGDQSYADLITQAINSVKDQRLTLSEIYDWMMKNVPSFKEKTDSGGWKNSIRHNLSLHNRFVRVPNSDIGKSSWWMINPNEDLSKSTRRRSATMEAGELEKKRCRVRKQIQMLKKNNQQSDGVDSISNNNGCNFFGGALNANNCSQSSAFRQRASSSASSCGRLSPILAVPEKLEVPTEDINPTVQDYEHGRGVSDLINAIPIEQQVLVTCSDSSESSWWMILNPNSDSNQTTRRILSTFEADQSDKEQGQAMMLRNRKPQTDGLADSIIDTSENCPLNNVKLPLQSLSFRQRASSSASSCGRLSPIIAAPSEITDPIEDIHLKSQAPQLANNELARELSDLMNGRLSPITAVSNELIAPMEDIDLKPNAPQVTNNELARELSDLMNVIPIGQQILVPVTSIMQTANLATAYYKSIDSIQEPQLQCRQSVVFHRCPVDNSQLCYCNVNNTTLPRNNSLLNDINEIIMRDQQVSSTHMIDTSTTYVNCFANL